MSAERVEGVFYSSGHQGFGLFVPVTIVRRGLRDPRFTTITIGTVELKLDHHRRRIIGDVPKEWLVDLNA